MAPNPRTGPPLLELWCISTCLACSQQLGSQVLSTECDCHMLITLIAAVYCILLYYYDVLLELYSTD